tara:strand:+ start:405 stop:785 length:381 start_codon:yes stop_codon:yes gene_type:complete
MALLTSLFSKLLGDSSKIIDEVVTSKEEKLTLRNELEQIINTGEKSAQEQVSKRWEADMKSDSWLSKNVRPMVLIFLIVCTMLLIFIDAGAISFVVDSDWKELLKMTLMTTVGAYFGGRSYEKVKK